MKFLLWNVQRKPLDGLVVRLVQDHSPSVIVLVEHPRRTPDSLLKILQGIGSFFRLDSHDRFGVYVRFKPSCMRRLVPPVANDRMDAWEFKRGPLYQSVTLVVVHGYDMRNHSEDKRETLFKFIGESISFMESSVGHRRTIVLGDFNANPFDKPVSSARGLHAIPVKHVNEKSSRRVVKTDNEFFYNPMWRCYGKSDDSPLATYYYYRYEVHELFWHMLDQVVMRPSVLPHFQHNKLRIVDRAGVVSLTDERGRPDDKHASDHLPVLFQLNLRR